MFDLTIVLHHPFLCHTMYMGVVTSDYATWRPQTSV